MRRQEMVDLVRREVAHIPDWPDYQRELRMVFWMNRMHSLGRKATLPNDPLKIIEQSVKECQKRYPKATFEFDRNFFEEESTKSR